MNIKLRAALEVTGAIVAMVAIATGVRALLDSLAQAYSPEQVINGIAFVVVATTAYVMAGLLYDMRVARLQYKQKLNEMVKK